MDREITRTHGASLGLTDLAELCGEPQLITYGAIMLVRAGEADISIGLRTYHLTVGVAMMLFPGDMVSLSDASVDLSVEMLRYDSALLREASLQLEQTVYDCLRADRCRGDRTVVEILEAMFALLRIYFRQDDCRCTDQLALYQVKSFFLGYYDYLLRRPDDSDAPDRGSRRTSELFSRFMARLESDYRLSQSVTYYAHALHISPKYLTHVVRTVTARTPKALIDHYVTLQIKLQLRTTDISIKEMAYEYHFSDASFFCRHFRAQTGMTPQAYRLSFKEQRTDGKEQRTNNK